MTLAELIAQVRVDSDDLATSYLSSDANITAWLNEAEEEAAIRAQLIHDVSTVAVCSIAVTAPTSVYTLHAAILDVTRAVFTPTGSTTEYELDLTDRIEQDRTHPGWRTLVDVPHEAIQLDTTLQLGCIPSTSGTISLEAYRLPLLPMVAVTDPVTVGARNAPEIGRVHHRHLVQWALHRCYSRPDAEVFNPNKAATALAEFERVFGLRPGSSYRRDSQANRPQINKAIW